MLPPILVLGLVHVEREIQLLEGLAAFDSQLRSDSSFFFEACNLVASRASVAAHEKLAFGLELGVSQERRRRVGRSLLLLQRHQVAGNIA